MTERSNGLFAEAYAPLVELDPPLVEQVLSLLATAGIAAYVEPVEGARGPYQDVQLPDRVLVQLHVDRTRLSEARGLVSQHVPPLRAAFLADSAARDDRSALAAAEVDAAWERIVAGYHLPTEPGGSWSPAEDIDDDTAETPPTRSGLSGRLVRHSDEGSEHGSDDGSDDGWDDGWDDMVDDPDDHFVPPPPPPLPEVDPITRLAWVGVIGGPTLVLLIAVLGISIESWVVLVALLAFCAGVATLVVRMGERPPHDDGWNDGAVV